MSFKPFGVFLKKKTVFGKKIVLPREHGITFSSKSKEGSLVSAAPLFFWITCVVVDISTSEEGEEQRINSSPRHSASFVLNLNPGMNLWCEGEAEGDGRK